MALTTTITPSAVAVALGQAAPESGSVTEQQWEMWISDALMLIQLRADQLAVTEIDQARIDYVVREAVVAQVKRPDSATQVTVSVDDASTSKTYRSSTGRIGILDEWWVLLGLTSPNGRAFEIDTMPENAGVLGVDYWWTTPTDITALP